VHPVHVTLRLRSGLPTLRQRSLANVVFAVFRRARERFGARLVEFSVQGNHLHLIVEAANKPALARAMQGLGIRLARRLNRRLRRRGPVFADRYHARALRTPTEVRRALVYVLQNHRKHGATGQTWLVDPFSSAAYFEGFKTRIRRWPRHGFAPPRHPVTAPPKGWLLRVGWRRLGLLDRREAPLAIV
jgi:REP element-mobilizing transposase RayT